MFNLKCNILIITFIILLNLFQQNIVSSFISERQHEFRGIIKPNVLFFNGIAKPIVWKVEVKCEHGCDDYLRFYIQPTMDNVENAGIFVIYLMAGKKVGKKNGGGYKEITQLRVYIRSMNLLAGQSREHTWEKVTPQLNKIHEFQFGHFDQILDEPFYLNFKFIEALPPIETSFNGLIKFKKYVASLHGKTPLREATSTELMSEICQKFSEKELTEREYLGIKLIKMELNEYSERVPTKRNLSLDRRGNFLNFLNYLESNEDYSLNLFVKQIPLCGICQGLRHSKSSIFKLHSCNDRNSPQTLRRTSRSFNQLYFKISRMPNLWNSNSFGRKNGDYPHYIYHIGQIRERKEYNKIKILSMSQEESSDDGSDNIESETSMDKRRRKGKLVIKEPTESPGKFALNESPLVKRSQKKHNRLIDLMKKSPVNLEFLAKLSRKIERKERRMEKEKKNKESEILLGRGEASTSYKNEGEKIQEVLQEEKLKEEDEEEIPLKRRTRERGEKIRERSQPIGSNNPLSIGILQLPSRSLSDQEATSKTSCNELREEFEDLSQQKTKQKEEIEQISSDGSTNIFKKGTQFPQNIEPWEWEGIYNLNYQASSSSPQISPIDRGLSSCEIVEETEEEKIEESKVLSPWFSEEEIFEISKEEDKSKNKKSKKILNGIKRNLSKLTNNSLNRSFRRTVSDIINKKKQ